MSIWVVCSKSLMEPNQQIGCDHWNRHLWTERHPKCISLLDRLVVLRWMVLRHRWTRLSRSQQWSGCDLTPNQPFAHDDHIPQRRTTHCDEQSLHMERPVLLSMLGCHRRCKLPSHSQQQLWWHWKREREREREKRLTRNINSLSPPGGGCCNSGKNSGSGKLSGNAPEVDLNLTFTSLHSKVLQLADFTHLQTSPFSYHSLHHRARATNKWDFGRFFPYWMILFFGILGDKPPNTWVPEEEWRPWPSVLDVWRLHDVLKNGIWFARVSGKKILLMHIKIEFWNVHLIYKGISVVQVIPKKCWSLGPSKNWEKNLNKTIDWGIAKDLFVAKVKTLCKESESS